MYLKLIKYTFSAIFLKCYVRAVLDFEETINDDEFMIYNEGIADISRKPRYARLVPVKNYLNKIDKANSNKLKGSWSKKICIPS